MAILPTLLRSKAANQVALLIGAQALGMILSFTFTIMVTKGLDVSSYGMFRYGMTFLALANTLLQFGLPFSASRLLAEETDRYKQKQITGACILMVVTSTLVGAITTLAVYFSAALLGYHLPRILVWLAPFLYLTLGQYMIGNICQGLNRISVLSFQQVLPYLILLPITAIQIYVYGKYSLKAAILGYIVVFSFVLVIGFLRLGVLFDQCRSWLRPIFKENKRNGLPIYVGGLFGVASTQVIALWVAGFTESLRYGQYALALAISSPLAVSVSSIGTVIFRSSSTRKAFSKKFLLYSFAFGGALGIGYFIATEYFLVKAFGKKYSSSIQMSQLLGVGALMIGWGDIFQRFLGAQGRGRHLCAVAISTGVVAIILAAILVPKWNAYGAIWSSVGAASTYFLLNLILYCQHTNRGAGIDLNSTNTLSEACEVGA